jgi:hypothetical protein
MRVGAYTGDSQVRELQFRPGITPGPKGIIPLDHIAWHRSRVLRQERNEIDRLGDFGLVEGLRPQSGHIPRKYERNKNPMPHRREAKVSGSVLLVNGLSNRVNGLHEDRPFKSEGNRNPLKRRGAACLAWPLPCASGSFSLLRWSPWRIP